VSTVTVVVCDRCQDACPGQAPGFNSFIVVNNPDGSKLKLEYGDLCKNCATAIMAAVSGGARPDASDRPERRAEPEEAEHVAPPAAEAVERFDSSLIASSGGTYGLILEWNNPSARFSVVHSIDDKAKRAGAKLVMPVTVDGSPEFASVEEAVRDYVDSGRDLSGLVEACSIAMSSRMPELVRNEYVILSRDLFSTVG
jgi:hypothetical protein